jgi:hypothetical protein
VQEEGVGESPDPMDLQYGPVGADSELHNAGRLRQGQAHNTGASGNSVPTSTMPTETTTYPDIEEGGSDGGDKQEEVHSSPQEPFIGMRFDTMEAARAHYNAYAAKIGFSVKSHTSKRKAHTNELEKQQFVCNKFRKPKTEEEIQKERMNVVEEVSPVQLDDSDNEDDAPSTKNSSRFATKRKRETIKQTNCVARMFVKLIDNKWEVTYFIAEHNHPLVQKPSLTKYLRSHRGIPRDEIEFLRSLHNCNLETGLLQKKLQFLLSEIPSLYVGNMTCV